MKIVTLPGAPVPTGRAACVADALRRETLPLRASVLDLGSGGLLAVTAARRGARSVFAAGSSPLERASARATARLNGVRIRSVADGFDGRAYDVILSSGDAAEDELANAAEHLRPCGFLLTACEPGGQARFALAVLRDAGLDAEIVTSPTDVVARRHETVVVRGRKPARPSWRAEDTAHAAL